MTQSLSQELRAFVATDTLNSLLHLHESAVTAETLTEVQQCLRDVAGVRSAVVSLDFVAPSAASIAKRQRDTREAGHGAEKVSSSSSSSSSSSAAAAATTSQHDFLASCLEREMRGQQGNAFSVVQSGDIMYVRSWTVSDVTVAAPVLALLPQGALSRNHSRASSPSLDWEAEAALVDQKLPRRIPCWVLISISHSASGAGASSSSSASPSYTNPNPNPNPNPSAPPASAQAPTGVGQTIALKINVSIRKTEGTAASIAGEHDTISRGVEDALQRCCFRINQGILLRELHESKLASPLLLPLHGGSPALSPSHSPSVTPQAPQDHKILHPVAQTAPVSGSQGSRLPPSHAPPLHPPGPIDRFRAQQITPVLGSTRQRAVTSLINLIPPRTSIRSKLLAAEAGPAPPQQHASFACPRQGVITCSIHSGAAVQYETAVRYLEKSALNQFAVENRDRYFVSEDEQGNVHYMMFDRDAGPSEAGRENNLVRLAVYGLQPMAENMSGHLQVLLNHRLMEVTAKTISPVLMRTGTLYASYGNFLRQNGTNRHVHYRFALPPFVTDVYFFLTLARQVMVATQVLSRVSMPNQRHISKAELLHPSTSGYSLHRDRSLDEAKSSAPLSPLSPLENSTSAQALLGIGKIHIEDRPMLVRSGGVVPTRGADKINPVFFGRQNLQRTRQRHGPLTLTLTGTDAPHEVVWQQGDFTLLYNIMAPLPPTASRHLRIVSKQAGQGLALVEIYPSLPAASEGHEHSYFTPQSQIMHTGSPGALEEDVWALQDFLGTEAKMAVTVLPPGDEGAVASG